MAGVSIGELFVSLGFDVDDAKLKSFNNEIQSAVSGMLRLAGVTASVGGFVALMGSVSGTAVQLRNLTQEFGYSARGAQEWISVLRQANPLLSQEQALGSYQKIAEYIRSIKMGRGAFALNQLGVNYQDNMTPENIIEQVRSKMPDAIKRLGRPLATQYISDVFGSVGAINALTLAQDDYEAKAKRGLVDDKDNANLVEYKNNIAQLTTEWDRFTAHILGANVAPALTEIMQAFDKGGFGDALDKIGEKSFLNDVGKWEADKMIKGSQAVADWTYDKNVFGQKSSEAMEFWKTLGYSAAQASALVANEKRESNFNEKARGDGGRANGIFQWHPDRVEAILKGTGIDVRTANHHQQLRAAAWELENTGMAARLKAINKPDEAGEFVSRKYLRPGVTEMAKDREANIRAKMASEEYSKTVTQNVTVNVQSTAPAHETAEEVNRIVQKHFSMAYGQRNQGASY